MHNISYSKQAEIDLEDVIEHIAKTSVKNATPYEVFKELTGIDAIILVKGIRL